MAIAGLLAFVQNNFLGPTVVLTESLKFPDDLNIRNLLKTDGEELNPNTVAPELLYVCKLAFEQLIPTEDNVSHANFIERLWYLRYLVVYQRCLDDLVHSLYSKFDQNVAHLTTSMEDVDNLGLKVQIHTEILQGYVLFKRITKSERWMTALQEVSGVEITIEGVLGIRTKHQQNPLPQLTVRAKGLETINLPSSQATHGQIALPTILKLDDDVRLEKIQFLSEQENVDAQLPSLIQEMVLSKM